MFDRRSILRGSVGASAVGVTALANASATRAANDGSPILVGAAVPLSGVAAGDGIEFKNGLDLAAEEINAAGGILGRKIEIRIEDTKDGGGDVVSQAMQRLVDRYSVPAIINGYNVGANNVEMDVAADNDVILMHANTSTSAVEKFKSDPGRFYGSFQTDPPEYWYGPGCLAFLESLIKSDQWKPDNKKLAIIPSANEYSILIANSIKTKAADYGFEIGLFETVQFPTSQWGPTLAKIRQDPPAAIIVTHFLAQDLAQFMLQFAPQPTKSLIYMQYGPSLPAFREIAGAAGNGVVYSTVIGCLPDDFSAAFRKKYREKYGPKASFIIGSQTYDALWKWALCAAIAGGPGKPSDKAQAQKVAAAMRRLVYRGVNGVLRVNPEGQASFCYPAQVADSSLGMPHQFLQQQDIQSDSKLISPVPYVTGNFVLPPWMS